MVERFMSGGGGGSEMAGIRLLSGPPSCGKTSLLFQCAVNIVACESEGHVVFICDRRRLNAHPPFLSQGQGQGQGLDNDCSHLFDRIHIKYIDKSDDESLNNFFAAFHLLNPPPRAVFVDDFPDFFLDSKCQQRYNNARGRDLAMVRVLALSHSAILHANKTSPCQLFFSDTHLGDLPRLFIYRRWLSSIFSVQGNGSGSFLLRNTFCNKGNAKGNKTARYSIALQYLVFEGFEEDGKR